LVKKICWRRQKFQELHVGESFSGFSPTLEQRLDLVLPDSR